MKNDDYNEIPAVKLLDNPIPEKAVIAKPKDSGEYEIPLEFESIPEKELPSEQTVTVD